MSVETSEEIRPEEIEVRLLEYPLNKSYDNKPLIVDGNYLVAINVPINCYVRVNDASATQIPLHKVRVLKGRITRLYLTTSTTSSEKLQLIVSNNPTFEVTSFGERVILIDENYIEYDARLAKQISTSVYSADIRDTNAHTSNSVAMEGYRSAVLTLNNGLDAEVTIKVEGSLDGSDWYQLGTDITISANNKEYETLTEAWIYIRITVTASTTPTSGTFTAKLALRSG